MLQVSLLLTAGLVAANPSNFPRTWNDFDVSDSKSLESLFGRFKTSFGKTYVSDAEERSHFETFSSRVHDILDWNEGGKQSYTKGITKFTDMSNDERQSYVMPETSMANATVTSRQSKGASDIVSKSLKGFGDALSCDLRPTTTSVKDQQSCGSCWAFGTMAAAEASHFLWAETDAQGQYSSDIGPGASNDAWQLSEQVLVECCDTENGCGGGGASGPMECATGIGALPSTVSHPYTAIDTTECSHTASQASAYVESWYQPCSSGDEDCLKGYIGGDKCDSFATVGMKTSIEVISSFYDYVDGVYSDSSCPDNKHNHAVGIVGWGSDDVSGKDYWIIRNSWGSSWGQGGYIYMERGVNMCCVACDNLFFQ